MADRFVRKTGSDAAAGSSAATAWLTIAKALATAVAGDNVYVGAGVYREQASAGNSGTSGNPITFTADNEGIMTGDAGEVRWTGYDNGDKALPTGANPALTINAKNYLTFNKFVFQGGSSNGTFMTGQPVMIIFKECTWLPPSVWNAGITSVVVSGACSVRYNRCRFFGGHASCGQVQMNSSGGANYFADVQYTDCLFVSVRHGINVVGGSGTGNGGGVIASRCTFVVGTSAMMSSGTMAVPAINPNGVDSSFIIAATALSAATSGQIVDNGNNVIYAQTALSNVTAGAGTITNGSYAPVALVGQEVVQGRRQRPFLALPADSPLLGYYAGAAGLTDLLDRPRPSGGASANLAVGALEAHDLATRETSVVPAGKSTAIKWTGPVDIRLRVPVGAVPTTISIQVRWDGSYGAGTLPQLWLIDDAEIGVAAQTVTATGAANAWQTITLATFTPTVAGEARLRLVSQAAGTGVVYWGAAAVSPGDGTLDFNKFSRGEFVDYLAPPSAGGGGGGGGVPRSRQFIGD